MRTSALLVVTKSALAFSASAPCRGRVVQLLPAARGGGRRGRVALRHPDLPAGRERLVGRHAVELGHLRHRRAVARRDLRDRLAALSRVVLQARARGRGGAVRPLVVLQRLHHATARGDDQRAALGEVDARVPLLERGGAHARARGDRLPVLARRGLDDARHLVAAVGRDALEERDQLVSALRRDAQQEGLTRRRRVATKLGVEAADAVEARVRQRRDQLKARRRRHAHRVVGERRHALHVAEAVLLGVLRDQDNREDVRHVVARLLRDVRVDGPEVPLAGARDGAVDVALARVVGAHRQLPVAEAVVQPLQVAGRGARRLLEAVALVDVGRLAQAEARAGAGDELPQPRGRGPRTRGRAPGALDLSEPDDVFGHALLAENLPRQRHVLAGAAQARLHRPTAATLVVVDEALDERVRRKAEVERVLDLVLELRHVVGRDVGLLLVEFERAQRVERRRLELLLDEADLDGRGRLHAAGLLRDRDEGGIPLRGARDGDGLRHLVAVDALDQLHVVAVQARVRAHVHARFEHGVDRLVERLAGGLALVVVKVELAQIEVLLGFLDDLGDARVLALDLAGRIAEV